MPDFLFDPLFQTIAMRTLAAIGGLLIGAFIIKAIVASVGREDEPMAAPPPLPMTQAGFIVLYDRMDELTPGGIQ